MVKRVLIAILLLLMLAVPSQARADVAPPAQPPGSSLQPGSQATQVRMLAETVVIDVRPGASDKSLGQAHVTANFTMHNLSDSAETMAARFPVGSSDGFSRVNELSDLQIKVAGKPVTTRRIMGEDPYFSFLQAPWAEFDVTFPAGQDTAIEVDYTLQASGRYALIWFKYILSTGAGWKDTIGSADIIVRLPYEANPENVLFDTDTVWFGTSRGGFLAGNEIRWHYADLEPTTDDNFEVNLVMPSAWQRLLAEQKDVAQNPRDGEAWGRLGKLCKEMMLSPTGKGFRSANVLDPGGKELYQLSLKAYEQAVTLLPKDALWHAGYADLLADHAYFDAFNGANTDEEAVHAVREIQTALALAPDDSQIQQIADTITYFFPKGMQRDGSVFLFPWLTATPSLTTSTPLA
ncbi:MAG: tetratricopeptide repeat protein [Anaerolineales bacterium]